MSVTYAMANHLTSLVYSSDKSGISEVIRFRPIGSNTIYDLGNSTEPTTQETTDLRQYLENRMKKDAERQVACLCEEPPDESLLTEGFWAKAMRFAGKNPKITHNWRFDFERLHELKVTIAIDDNNWHGVGPVQYDFVSDTFDAVEPMALAKFYFFEGYDNWLAQTWNQMGVMPDAYEELASLNHFLRDTSRVDIRDVEGNTYTCRSNYPLTCASVFCFINGKFHISAITVNGVPEGGLPIEQVRSLYYGDKEYQFNPRLLAAKKVSGKSNLWCHKRDESTPAGH